MGWGGSPGSQTFTRTNGTYSGTNTWAQDSANGVKITSTNHDTHDQDVASGINACLKKDGGNSATADIPMGGNKFTNVGVATSLSHFARLDQVQNGVGVYVPTVGGTANAITLTTGWNMASYVAGQTFRFIAAFNNSDLTTVNVDGLGAKNIKVGTTGLAANQILISTMIEITYDGTQFQLTVAAAAPAAIAVGSVMAWPMTTVPTGWLECDGSLISRSTFSALFAAISTNYGVGDGSTTFALPNYKDYFLRGFDPAGTDVASRLNRGDGTTGAAVGTKQGDDFKSHTHGPGSLGTDSQGAHTHTYVTSTFNLSPSGGTSGGTIDGVQTTLSTGSSGAHTHSVTTGITGATFGTIGTETRPANVTVKWIILALPSNALAIGTGFTRSPRLCHTGGIPAQVSTDGTDTTPSITETYIAEVFLPGPGSVSVTGISIFNGSANVGNIKVALADCNGNIVASSASVASSGIDSYQRVPFSTPYNAVGPATYFVLLQNSSASNRFNSHTFGDFGASKKTGETFGTFTTISAPSTFTTGQGPIASLY